MSQRFDNLQAIRGFACLLVVVAHAGAWEARFGGTPSVARTAAFLVAELAIDLLFVTSGFILTYSYFGPGRRPGGVGVYLWRRAWRVFPTYWVALALAVAAHTLVFGAPPPPPGWGYVWDLAWLRPRAEPLQILPVAWTMTYEVMFYVAFAAALVLPGRVVVAGAVGWSALVVGLAAAGVVPESAALMHLIAPYQLELLGGCLAAWLATRERVYPATALALGSVWLVGCLAAGLTVYPPLVNMRLLFLGVPAVLLVYGSVAAERAGWRGPRWLCRVGDRSYSIYLVHWIAQAVIFYVTLLAGMSHTRTWHAVWFGLMVAGGLGFGLVFYQLVERPVMAVGRGRRPAVPRVGWLSRLWAALRRRSRAVVG